MSLLDANMVRRPLGMARKHLIDFRIGCLPNFHLYADHDGSPYLGWQYLVHIKWSHM